MDDPGQTAQPTARDAVIQLTVICACLFLDSLCWVLTAGIKPSCPVVAQPGPLSSSIITQHFCPTWLPKPEHSTTQIFLFCLPIPNFCLGSCSPLLLFKTYHTSEAQGSSCLLPNQANSHLDTTKPRELVLAVCIRQLKG